MADKETDAGTSPRYRMATGEGEAALEIVTSDFGCQSLADAQGSAHTPPAQGKTLHDHERAARPPIKGNQANPDHGSFYK